jgi:CHAT domain-containing protein
MVRFYTALWAGRGRGEALRQASLEVRNARPHPYYWAPFVLVGQSGALAAPK